jgi:hypothetical protein
MGKALLEGERPYKEEDESSSLFLAPTALERI